MQFALLYSANYLHVERSEQRHCT